MVYNVTPMDLLMSIKAICFTFVDLRRLTIKYPLLLLFFIKCRNAFDM